ncbi:MAG: hypothetical protein ACHQ7N_04475 [Candidatus Methylomirabilales bacterium]
MREPRRGQGQGTNCLVLNRSCADLYDEIAELFADQSYIEVIVDRRRGGNGMAKIPAGKRRGAGPRKGRASPRMVSVRLRREAS